LRQFRPSAIGRALHKSAKIGAIALEIRAAARQNSTVIDSAKAFREVPMRCMLPAIVACFLASSLANAAPTRVQLEDGTVIEVDVAGVAVGGKIEGKVISRGKPMKEAAKGIDAESIVRAHLKANVNDASRLEVVSFGKPIDATSCVVWVGGREDEDAKGLDTALWQPVRTPGVAVECKYRAANAVGALILRSDTFFIGEDGAVFKVCRAQDVRTSRPELKTDPHLDEFFAIGGGTPNGPKVKTPVGELQADPREPSRGWRSKDGKTTINGKFAGYSDGMIYIVAKDGKVSTVKMLDMCQADQVYVERKAAGK
jgi:hypothetical protein